MRTITLTTEPFTCPSCVGTIEKAISRKPGVGGVRVLFNSNRVQISFDDSKANAEELSKAVADLGYPIVRVA